MEDNLIFRLGQLQSFLSSVATQTYFFWGLLTCCVKNYFHFSPLFCFFSNSYCLYEKIQASFTRIPGGYFRGNPFKVHFYTKNLSYMDSRRVTGGIEPKYANLSACLRRKNFRLIKRKNVFLKNISA